MFNNTGNNSAYLGMNIPISSASINGTGLMLNQRVKYTAKTGIAIVSAANVNLDGSGTLVDLITGANSGTLVKRIIIKAQGTTTQGMVRIFHYDNVSATFLSREIEIPAVTQLATSSTFIYVIDELFYLKSGHKLKVSTQVGNTFIVTAEGLDITYP